MLLLHNYIIRLGEKSSDRYDTRRFDTSHCLLMPLPTGAIQAVAKRDNILNTQLLNKSRIINNNGLKSLHGIQPVNATEQSRSIYNHTLLNHRVVKRKESLKVSKTKEKLYHQVIDDYRFDRTRSASSTFSVPWTKIGDSVLDGMEASNYVMSHQPSLLPEMFPIDANLFMNSNSLSNNLSDSVTYSYNSNPSMKTENVEGEMSWQSSSSFSSNNENKEVYTSAPIIENRGNMMSTQSKQTVVTKDVRDEQFNQSQKSEINELVLPLPKSMYTTRPSTKSSNVSNLNNNQYSNRQLQNDKLMKREQGWDSDYINSAPDYDLSTVDIKTKEGHIRMVMEDFFPSPSKQR